MTDLVTDAMVESAAATLYGERWDDVDESTRIDYRTVAAEMLTAAAPLIAAAALRCAADEVRTHSYKPDEVTGVPTSEQVSWLVGTSDAHRMVDRLLKDRAERFEHDARCPHRKCPGAVGVCCCPAVES